MKYPSTNWNVWGNKVMGKIDSYAAGRAEGMLLARDIVKKDGIEELEREIRFRNITGVNLGISRKELEKATVKIKNMTLDTILVIAVATLHDEFDFGAKRCQRFIKRLNLKAECLMDDMATWKDYIDTIKEELGIEMVIRENN